jgi:hypothetical protein
VPTHWSGLTVIGRARRLGPDYEAFVIRYYDAKNQSAHTGVGGFTGLPPIALEMLSALALQATARCFVGIIATVGLEFGIDRRPGFTAAIQKLREIEFIAEADQRLRAAGEPQRVFVYRDG